MKTIHLSIITSIGIVIAASFGIVMFVFPHSFLSTESKPTCNGAPNPSTDIMTLNKTTWISVMEINANQTALDCSSLNQEFLSSMPKLKQALYGADQCMQGKDEVCSFPSGVSLVMLHEGIIPVADSVNYQASLTQNEANSLLNNVRLAPNGNLVAGDVEYDGKYYQILLSTSGETGTPQVRASYATELGYVPVHLARGQSINYTITVNTLATFGRQAQVQLYATTPVHDSGLNAKIVPDTLFIPERSQANATLIITAGPDAQNGTYQIGFYGKIPNGGFTGGINEEPCPCIRVGDSYWTISMYGTNGYGGMGGKQPPQWLRVETTTDKQVYHTGETVEIENFLINDSPNKVILENELRMFVNIYNQVNGTGTYRYFYGIDALYDGKPVLLEPHSKIMIARPFYWDQSDLRDQSVSHKVILGNYIVDVSFGSYDGAVWDNDVPIVIK